jgi:hypothetical protein
VTTLTVMCIPCGGSGREPLGEITVKCHVCNGVGSVPASAAESKPSAPTITLEEIARQLREVQLTLLDAFDPDRKQFYATLRMHLREIERDVRKFGGTL